MAEQVTSSLVGRVVDSLFGVAQKEILYMWNCSENVQKFGNEAEKLKHMRGRVLQHINLAKEKGEDLLDGVQDWMDKADAQISLADDFLLEEAIAKKSCFNLRLCVNLGTLHHYGREVLHRAPSLLQHQEDGKVYEGRVSIPTSKPGFIDLYQKKNLDALKTEKLALVEIIKSIKDESIQIIGVYGVGGVGKTTLAKEVASRVNNLFADVVFLTVSQTVDHKKIEKEVEAAAKRIMKGEKILIILDDLWGELKLEDVGIPCGRDHMNCKILLTTRRIYVCATMNVEREICVNPLPPNEAWILFKHVIGENVEANAKLKQVAVEVAKECGGLPLIIQIVGKALKNQNIKAWETALTQLNKNAPLDIAPDLQTAYTSLKLSYDLLESVEAKVCFLLCGMFPEDYFIPLEKCVLYGVGLEMFKDLDSIDDARCKVVCAMDILQSCFLLEKVDQYC